MPRLGEFTKNDELQMLSKQLVTIQKYLACKKPLTGDEEEMLISSLLEFFPEFSISEIDRAVKLVAVGELEVDDNEHYEKFGSIYLSKILKAYRKMRNRVVMKYQKMEIDKITELSKKLTPEEIEEINRNGAIRMFEEFKKNRSCNDFGNCTFNYLFRNGFISKFSEAEKKQIRVRAIERMRTQAAYLTDRNEKKRMFDLVEIILTKNLTEDQRLKSQMKQVALADYFTELIAQEKELSYLLAQKINTKNKTKHKAVK